MDYEIVAATDFTAEQIAATLNEGFKGYVVPVEYTVAVFYSMIRMDAINPTEGLLAIVADQPVAAAIVARRGVESRLAAMAIAPDFRGKGIGRALLAEVVRKARERGERRLWLEVIQSNEPAVKLYESAGFRSRRELFSFGGRINPGPARIEEISMAEAVRHILSRSVPDLPAQISGYAIAQIGLPSRAYSYNDSVVVISDPNTEAISVRAAVGTEIDKLLGGLSSLLQDRVWAFPAIFPAELAPQLESVGLERRKLAQFQMVLEL